MIDVEHLRSHSAAWKQFAYLECEEEEHSTYDGNADVRQRLLLLLQHDRQDSDAELVRYLFTNEIIAAENDSFQGCRESLILAACLLARFRDPEDAPLFARAKLANFDTTLGFPTEFIFFVGGDQTEQSIRLADGELWDHFSALFDPAIPTDDLTSVKLNQWWQQICEDYPDSEEQEHLFALFERAMAFNDRDLAMQYLEEWADQERESESKHRHLMSEYTRLGDFTTAANMATRILEHAKSHWDRASALRDIVTLQRRAGDFSQSLNAARQLEETFGKFDNWTEVGLGRMAIHDMFELSLTHPELSAAREAFLIADRCLQRSRQLALIGLEAAAKAAQRCGFADEAERYNHLATAERERIDAMLKGL